jgi:hypothetical protein
MQGPDCLECGARLTGRYCARCGQKRIEPEERRLRWFFEELGASLVGADGRARRTIASFLLRPGELGAAWLAGRRARYLSPLAVFLLVNLVYFVAPPLTDFNLPLADQVNQVGYGEHARALIEARLAARGTSLEDYAPQFQLEAYSLAKVLVIVHPVLFAPLLALLYWRRRIPLVDHLAVALHLWAADLLALMVVPAAAGLLVEALAVPAAVARPAFQATLVLVIGWYIALTLRRAYGTPRWLVPFAAALLFAGAAATHLLAYRPLLFYAAFALS